MTAETKIEIIMAGPAIPAAIPIITKIPAPIIAPRLIITAERNPRILFNP
ncbi:MAG: hypothetical protein AMDU4_FER2C00057G0023 [Ferroplasma sp. Type II]|nr:MAG: hypothetical protein AMDU4_FER2C00057G0023 [Ferroplasma sp. Type II]